MDFEKAYHSVSWSFLDSMFVRFAFDVRCMAWTRACIFSGNLLVLVNGCLTDEICIHMGLKRGDPLTPFLLLLVAEGFNTSMKRVVSIDAYFRV